MSPAVHAYIRMSAHRQYTCVEASQAMKARVGTWQVWGYTREWFPPSLIPPLGSPSPFFVPSSLSSLVE